LSYRLIARLDIKGDNVVRGMHLEGLRVVGRPEDMARRYAAQGIDEIIFTDTVASLYGRNSTLPVIERTAKEVFIPLTVGGGIRSLADVAEVLRVGGDKVTFNSAAVRRPELLTEVARNFGSQCVVAAIEAKRVAPGKWTVLIENAREPTGRDALEWAREVCDRGAGEFLLTSIDQDGMRKGYDLELTRAVTQMVPVPVIASGGPSTVAHVQAALQDAGASAAALGTLLHFNLMDVPALKLGLGRAGLRVRPAVVAGAATSVAGS
jgi:cyclase